MTPVVLGWECETVSRAGEQSKKGDREMGVAATQTVDVGIEIGEAVRRCFRVEKELGLAQRSLRSCGGYLQQFTEYCRERGVRNA